RMSCYSRSCVQADARNSRIWKRRSLTPAAPLTRPAHPGEDDGAAMSLQQFPEAAALAGRLLLSALFLHEAYAKLTAYSAAVAYSEAFGVPGALLPLAIVAEVGCGALILIGFYTRAAALILAAFCVAAAVLFKTNSEYATSSYTSRRTWRLPAG